MDLSSRLGLNPGPANSSNELLTMAPRQLLTDCWLIRNDGLVLKRTESNSHQLKLMQIRVSVTSPLHRSNRDWNPWPPGGHYLAKPKSKLLTIDNVEQFLDWLLISCVRTKAAENINRHEIRIIKTALNHLMGVCYSSNNVLSSVFSWRENGFN